MYPSPYINISSFYTHTGGRSSSSAVGIHQHQSEIATSPPPSAVVGSWKSTGSSDADQNSAFPSFAQVSVDNLELPFLSSNDHMMVTVPQILPTS